MPFKNIPRELTAYYNALRNCTTPIVCCNESLLPKHFEKHCQTHHNFDTKTGCAWCKRLTWRIHEKHKHGSHLLTCFKTYIKPPHHLLDMTHPFPEKDFFGHVLTHPDPMFDETVEDFLNIPVSPLPLEYLPPLPITFQDESLNLAASCVLLYLSDTFDFFHVMIKLVTWDNFVQVINQSNCYTLPYSCWCDGGKYQEPHLRQHRHLIVVSPKNHFEERIWPQVKVPRSIRAILPPKFPCKTFKHITSPLYLINAIGYLSQRKSRCDFSFKPNKRRRKRNNHFYIYKTLPADFKIHLALLWEGGLLKLLDQTKFQNISVARLAQGILTHNGRRWTQKIKDFYGHERGFIVRVDRDYVPATATRETPHFLHIAQGRKLYFEKLPEKLDPETWLHKQIEGGNRFYDLVEELNWFPRKKDQQVLNFHKPLVDKCRLLEARVTESANIIQSMETQLNRMNLETNHLKNQIIQCKDEEIERLKQEISRLESIIIHGSGSFTHIDLAK